LGLAIHAFPYPVFMSLTPQQFRAGRVLMLAFLFVLLQRDVADLLTAGPPSRSLIASQLLVFGICATYGWFWLRVAGTEGWRRSAVALVALTLLVTAFTLTAPGTSYPFYYPYYYCAIVAGAAFSWRPGLVAVSTVVVLAMAVVVALQARGVVTLDLVVVMILLGLGSLAVRRHVANFVQLQVARDEIRRLAVAEERLRLARDLHDQLGQSLSTVVLQSELVALELPDDAPESARARVQVVVDTARESLQAMRAVVTGYRQPNLADELHEARGLLEASGVRCEVREQEVEASVEASATLGWAVREAATNILRHSSAHRATLTVERQDGRVRLRVEDDGVGAGGMQRGHGLDGIAERASAMGGAVEIETSAGRGFVLTVDVPARH
jgi:two-component system sensor histidine kinase DesK